MVIAVTGGTGFIGRALVQAHLKRGDQVRILSRRPHDDSVPDGATLYRGELISSVDLLSRFVDGADILYHCAGEIRDHEKMYSVHVTGTGNLCTAACGRIGRWVQLSSVGAYGFHAGGKIDEETPLCPVGPYETTKVESDGIVIQASREGAFSYSILRPSNVYAPDMSNRSLFQLIDMIRRGLFFFIGRPGASANYIHLANVVEALMLCGSAPSSKAKVFNLSDHCTLEALIAIIADELGCRPPALRLPERAVRCFSSMFGSIPGFPLSTSRIDALTTRCIYSIDKIQNELGYVHVLRLDEGIRQLVRAWKQSK